MTPQILTITHSMPTEIGITVQVTNHINDVIFDRYYVLEIDAEKICNEDPVVTHGPYDTLDKALEIAYGFVRDVDQIEG